MSHKIEVEGWLTRDKDMSQRELLHFDDEPWIATGDWDEKGWLSSSWVALDVIVKRKHVLEPGEKIKIRVVIEEVGND